MKPGDRCHVVLLTTDKHGKAHIEEFWGEIRSQGLFRGEAGHVVVRRIEVPPEVMAAMKTAVDFIKPKEEPTPTTGVIEVVDATKEGKN